MYAFFAKIRNLSAKSEYLQVVFCIEKQKRECFFQRDVFVGSSEVPYIGK